MDYFLFNLIIIGALKHSNGLMWRRNNTRDLYLIEIMPPFLNKANASVAYHSLLNYLPRIVFRTPKDYYYDLMNLSKAELSKLQDNLFETFYKGLSIKKKGFFVIHII